MSERSFSSQPGFGPYVYEDRDTGEVFSAPFPASVFGIRKELLGVGTVIGAITDEDWDGMPVIQVEDVASPSGFVEILGVECWWGAGVDEAMTELLASEKAGQAIVSASVYV